MTIEYIIEEIHKIDPHFKKLAAFNQKQTGQILGVSESALGDWRKTARGPEFVKAVPGKGRVLYPKAKIAEFLLNTTKTV